MSVKVALRSASLSAGIQPEVECELFPGEWFVSYLKLFPEVKRFEVYGALGDKPTLEAVVAKLGGFSGLLELDECLNLRVDGNVCYITEQRGFDEYFPFGFYRTYRNLEFEAPLVRVSMPVVDMTRLPQGYCYLRGVQEQTVCHAATLFGAFPVLGDVRPYLRPGTLLEVNEVGGHISSEPSSGAVALRKVPPTVCIGGETCCNTWNAPGEHMKPCEACMHVDPGRLQLQVVTLPCAPPTEGQDKDPTLINDRYRVLKSRTSAEVDLLLVPDDIDAIDRKLSGVDPSVVKCLARPSHVRQPEGCDVVSYAYVHECASSFKTLVVDAAYWAIELMYGESLANDRMIFTPGARHGGVVVGCGRMEFAYTGHRPKLVVRRFSDIAYTRFTHSRLSYGHASRLKAVVDRSASHYLLQPFNVVYDDRVDWGPDFMTEIPQADVSPSMTFGRLLVAKDRVDAFLPIGDWGTVVSTTGGRIGVGGGVLCMRRLAVVTVSTCRGASGVFRLRTSRGKRKPIYTSVAIADDPEAVDEGGLSDLEDEPRWLEYDVSDTTSISSTAQEEIPAL